MFQIDNTGRNKFRYDLSKFCRYSKGTYDILDSQFLYSFDSIRSVGSFIVSTEEGRLDLISHKLYNSTKYWWLLMLFNKLTHPSQVKAAVELFYPSIRDLDRLYFELNPMRDNYTNLSIEGYD